MFKNIAKALGGDPQKRELDRMSVIVEQINALEAEYAALCRMRPARQNRRISASAWQQGETLDDILPEAFAAVREASKRTTGLRHYDIQLIGGMVLHKGTIAEMRTGEGKTLVATLPLYLERAAGQRRPPGDRQ